LELSLTYRSSWCDDEYDDHDDDYDDDEGIFYDEHDCSPGL